MPKLKQLADMCEQMAALDFSKQPNFLFMNDLVDSLVKQAMSVSLAYEVVAQIKVNISTYDSDNDDWKRIVESYSSMILQLRKIFGDAVLKTIAGQLSITYEF